MRLIGFRGFSLPLSIPFIALAIPTAFLWYLDRPRKTGCKKCGYSLEGLPAASPCPECGSKRLSV